MHCKPYKDMTMLHQKSEKRIDQYLQLLKQYAYRTFGELEMGYAQTEQHSSSDIYPGPYEGIGFPFSYGEPWKDYWFRTTVVLPASSDRLFLLLDTETDTLVYIDGTPYGATNPFHRKLEVTQFAGSTVEVHLQAWGGHRFPGYHPSEGGRVQACVAVKKNDYPLVFKQPLLLCRQESVYQLYYDVLVLRGLSKTLDRESLAYQHLISHMLGALQQLSLSEDPSAMAESVRAGLSVLLEAHNGSVAASIFSVGSAHLDHAWLWPIAETTRKAARTVLNMVNFTEQYPDFVFLFSQSVQTEALKNEYPTVYQRVLEAYRRGNWEPNGVCYVEPDCMLPSGESLIRQNLVGRQVTASLFDGYEGDVFYLPDSFGFTAALPQILVGCRVKYFVTSKLSWNDTNRFPYDAFLWESLDGTRIPAHMIQGAYEGTNEPEDLCKAYASVQHKDIQPALFRPVGEGDGGGGTLRSDLELMRREADLQGLPKNRWCTLSEAMQTIFRDTSDLPVYTGELYLELHRGTYTSQAKLKWWNRTMEHLLGAYEYVTSLQFATAHPFDTLKACLDAVWKQVLINQFHDILPGSSVQVVNVQARAAYEQAYARLHQTFSPFSGPYALNVSPFAFPLPDGSRLPSHHTRLLDTDVPLQAVPAQRHLDTEWAIVSLDGNGGISSLIRKKDGRQLVEPNCSLNTLTIGEDYPVFWDAWDLERDTLALQKPIGKPERQEYAENDHQYVVDSWFALGKASRLHQRLVCYKKMSRIDFATEVDWQEQHQLLRVTFPTTVRSQQAWYDVPFGMISRPTHTNTTLERAKFEVPAHAWAALDDRSLAVALCTDSKYGYHATNGTLSVSLLRSPTAPDPSGDAGNHSFTYAFVVSDEGLLPIQEHANAINHPLVHMADMHEPLVEVLEAQVVVHTVKVSEDGGSLVLRLREWMGSSVQAHLRFSDVLDPESLVLANMLEESIEGEALFRFKPFEVKTFLIKVRTLQ
ncbi:alpha-mannosidase [Sphaerochaeta sp.]|uniref:alpha-mannosidase n=1 Tax=Sphaerochaeta sp. TaxID=1972642 RepID=UPI002FC5DEFE